MWYYIKDELLFSAVLLYVYAFASKGLLFTLAVNINSSIFQQWHIITIFVLFSSEAKSLITNCFGTINSVNPINFVNIELNSFILNDYM